MKSCDKRSNNTNLRPIKLKCMLIIIRNKEEIYKHLAK